MEEQLIQATWILAGATALLVIATAIPAFQKFMDIRKEKENSAAQIIPDLNILKSRVRGCADFLQDIPALKAADVKSRIKNINNQLEILYRVITVKANVSLRVINELFILRHLLTQAERSLSRALPLFEKSDEQSVRNRDEEIRRARRLLVAADITIKEVESRLPKWARLIDGETFWDRFSRIGDEREGEAEKTITDMKFPQRSK